MKNLFAASLVSLLFLAISPNLFAQNVSINADGSLADTSAMLDVGSTTKGFLLPRMTTLQQNSIVLPAKGLTIFNTTLNSIMINTGTALSPIWSGLAAGAIDTSSIANFSIKVRSLFGATAPITYSNGLIGISQSGTSTNGYLSSIDWNTFNNKQPAGSYLTANQTITLSGDVTGSGITAITTNVGKINGTSLAGLGTGILKNTTGTGVPSIAVAGTDYTTPSSTETVTNKNLISGTNTFPTFNQNTTGSAAKLTTGRTIAITGDLTYTSPAFDGSANVTAAGTLATVNANVGSFTNANITVNGKGLITAASNGTAGTVTNIATGYGLSGGPITSTGTIIVDSATLHLKFLALKDSVNSITGYTTLYQNSLKQNQLNGTGFVKASGTTISYDNSIYLTGNQSISFNPSGDVTGLAVGTTSLTPSLTIGANKVTNAKLAKMATLTIKGNNTGGLSDPLDLTVAQVNAILPVFTSTLNGLVPFSGGGTTNFLRADGTWADPSSNAWNITGNSGTSYAINFLGTTDNKSLRFRTNNTENMIIDSTGNVGIGISAFDPVQPEKLLVNAGTHPNNGSVINSTPINAIGASNGFQQIQVQNRSWGNYSSSDLIAASDGTTNGTQPVNTETNYVDLGINSSGYTNNNSNILNQPYTSYLYATSPQTFYIGNGYSGQDIVFFTNHGPTNSNNTADGYEIMRLKGGTAQQVTIGTPTPNGTNKLTVSGSISASAFNVSSDRRLKTNITSLQYGLREILALQPVSYNWKKTPATDKQLGLIAQDAKKEIPEIVSGNEKTGTLSINYTELVPILINAIKEQQQQIDDLKKDIELLKNKK